MKAEHIPTKKHKVRRKANRKRLINIAIVCIVGFGAIHFSWRPVLSQYYQMKINRPVKQTEPKIKNGVLVDGMDLSGMTYEKALNTIKSKIKTDYEGVVFTIESSDGKHKYEYTLDDFDIKFNIDDTVKQAVNFAQTSSDNWWREFKTLESGTVNMPVMTYSPDKVNAAINKIKSDIIVEAKDATEKRVSGSFQVSQSQTGYNFDYEKVLNELTQSIKNNDFNKTIKFDITETKPKYESSIFTGADKLIGNYSSQYKGNDENRVQNLRNACSKINGVILYPGEEFSTNAHFNPCTEENGWALAGTIVKGKIEDSVGGGMCQVSSALYDSVLYAELEVTERHNHSMKVGYSPYAFDATLAGDYKDFKFKNNTNKAVYIESYLTSSNVVVNLYGEEIHPAGRTIELENKLIEETDPDEPVEKKDPTLLEGETEVVTPLKGYKYELYKKVYENGVLKETVKINTSTYSPRQQVTYIGTKKAETTTESTETTTKS